MFVAFKRLQQNGQRNQRPYDWVSRRDAVPDVMAFQSGKEGNDRFDVVFE